MSFFRKIYNYFDPDKPEGAARTINLACFGLALGITHLYLMLFTR